MRADRTKAVYKGASLSCAASAGMVEQVTKGICNTLATGKTVKLSGFGVFTVTEKGVRVGRNPKTGVEVSIASRKSITFRASSILEAHVDGGAKKLCPA